MNRARRRLIPAFLTAVVLLAGPLCPVRADSTEQRDYEIRVDDRPAGKSRLTIMEKDGATVVTARAKVQVKLFGAFVAYSYEVTASETWSKAGLLVDMKCSATEDGKKTDVDVTPAGTQLAVRVNGKNIGSIRPDVWASSYWKLADKRYHNKTVPILDADTGKVNDGQLQYVGTETLKVGARAEECYRFSITGIPVPIEVWVDRDHRLVRQEFTESGHKTIIQLLPGAR
jgi:hypothetical protein